MHDTSPSFTVSFNESNQEVALAGVIRPSSPPDFAPISDAISDAARRVAGTLYLNLKRLRHLNHTALRALAACLSTVHAAHPGLLLKLVTSSAIPGAERRLASLCAYIPTASVEVYDKDFYPGQGVIENDQFIPVLRTQTKIVWKHEQHLLRAHGLREGMRVADICCGIGDFAILLQKTFSPQTIVAIDHSKPFLAYARNVAQSFGFNEIDYRFGDAANLLLDDNTFDFVTCRLSLQIFSRPEEIIRELFRITKPGGRVYLTNEYVTQIHGFPRHDAIRFSFQKTTEFFAQIGSDLEFGPKMKSALNDCGLEDIRVDFMPITNINTDPDDFALVVQSWSDYILGDLATLVSMDEPTRHRMRDGFQDQIYAIKSRRGFALWPIYVASGTKPTP